MNFINELAGKRCLQFNNASGGGHKQVIEAITKAGKESSFITKDVIKDVVGETLGNRLHGYWNSNMKAENVKNLQLVVKTQRITEFFFSPLVFFKTVYWLLKNDIQAVVNPQPATISAIVNATRLVNKINEVFRRKKETILVYNVVTEMPTKFTDDYFPSYRRLSSASKKICKLVSLAPLTDESNFWEKNTGFSKSQVIELDTPLVREPFLKAAKLQKNEINKIKIKSKSDEGKQLLQNCLGKVDFQDGCFTVNQNDKVISIMLGSQAAVESTKQYVRSLIKEMSEQNVFAFVFAGDHKPGTNSLVKQIHDIVQEEKAKGNYSEKLHIIPLEGQNAEEVAPIMRRSNITITRAGGLTAMELYVTKPDQIFIHSPHEDVFKGMPTHEAGNFIYLQQKLNAKLALEYNTSNEKEGITTGPVFDAKFMVPAENKI